eukprot:10937872-Ditylum_brightwellii.AAC.1
MTYATAVIIILSISNIANLIGRKKGLHRNLTFVHTSALAEATFKLNTALGQGSTNSPTIWLIINSTLFDTIEKLGQTNKYYNNNATPEELIHLMQHDAQLWSDLLWTLSYKLDSTTHQRQ